MSRALLDKLEHRLADRCRRARAETGIPDGNGKSVGDGKSTGAYARGLSDALAMVRQIRAEYPDTAPPEEEGQGMENPLRLHQMAPARVKEMDVGAWPMEELVEAAFTFENMLMDLLEDDNTLPFDLYSGYSPAQLEDIIKKAAEKICRIQNA